MQILTVEYLRDISEERRAKMQLSTSDTLLPVPNRAGLGPRVATLMRQHGESFDGDAA